MIETYKIGVIVALDDKISAGLVGIAAELKRTQALVDSFVKSLSQIKSQIPDIGKINLGSNSKLEKTASHLDEIQKKLSAIGSIPAYSIPTAPVAPVAPTIPKTPANPKVPGANTAQTMSAFSTRMAGHDMASAGFFGAGFFKGQLAEAQEFEKAQARFKTLNLGAAINKEADEYARGAKVFGVSATALTDTLRESYGMLGNMDMAKQIAPMISSLNSANATLFGEKAQKIDGRATQSIMRYIDMRGYTNSPDDVKKGLDEAQKLVTGSGGAMKFGDLEQFMKKAGTAGKSLSSDGIYMMSTMMQEMGGSGTGNAAMSLYQNLVAGRSSKKAMSVMDELGLAKLEYQDHGMIGGKKFQTLQVKDVENKQQLIENPGQWLISTVLPKMAERGITDPTQIAAKVNDMLGNRTASNMGVNFTTQMVQSLRDAAMAKNAMGVDDTVKTAKSTMAGTVMDYEAKMANLKLVLGQTILPLAVRGLEALIGAIDRVTAFAKEYPTLTKLAMTGLAAVSALALVGGGALLVGAGMSALGLTMIGQLAPVRMLTAAVSGAFTGLARIAASGLALMGGAVMAGLRAIPVLGWAILAVTAGIWVVRNWDTVLASIKQVMGGIAEVWRAGGALLGGIVSALWTGVKTATFGFVGWFSNQWQALFNGLAGMLNAVLPKSMQLGKATFGDKINAAAVANLNPASYSNEGRLKATPAPIVNMTTMMGATIAKQAATQAPASAQASPYVKPATSNVTVTVNNKIDERGLATMVTKHQTREATRPGMGSPAFDPSMAAMPVGLAYAQ